MHAAGKGLNTYDRDEWMRAVSPEVEPLHKAQTWTLVRRPAGVKVIPNKRIRSHEPNSDENLVKNKVGLVFCKSLDKGITEETFLPVLDLTNIKLVPEIAAQRQCRLQEIDSISQTLQGTMPMTAYVMAISFAIANPGQILGLRKTLRQPKKSTRNWSDLLKTEMPKKWLY